MAEVDKLDIKIKAEASSATQSLDKLIDNLDTVQKNLRKITSAFDFTDARGEVVSLGAALRNLGKDFNFKGSVKELDSEIRKAEKRLETLARREKKALATGTAPDSKSWKNLQYDIAETSNMLEKLREQRGKVEVADPLAGMTITIDGVAQSFEKWSSELKETGVELDNVNRKSDELLSRLKGANAPEIDRLSSLMNNREPAQSIISEDLQSAADKAMSNAGNGSKEFNKLVSQVQRAESALERLYTRQEKMQFLGVKEGSKSFKGLTFDIETSERRLKSLYEKLVNTSAAGEMISESFGDKTKKGILSLSGIFRTLTGNMKKNSDAGRSIGFSMKNMIVSGLIMSTVFRTISLITSGMGQGFTNLARYCSDTNYSISTLRSGLLQLGNGFAAAFSPILNFVAPVLSQLISMLNAAASAISQFFAILTGKSTYITAKNNFQDYAAGLDGVGGSASGAADAAKELKRELLGFDEVTKLSDTMDATGGSGGGSGSGSSVGDLFETKEVDSTLQNNVLEWLDKLKTKAGPTLKALEKLRKEGLAKLGKFTFEGLKDFYNNFLVPVGSWTLGEGLPRFINITNDFLNSIHWDKINNSLERFWKALAPFATGIGEGLIDFYEDLMAVGADFINAVVPGGLDALSGILEKFDKSEIEGLGYAFGALGAGISTIKITNSLIAKLQKLFGVLPAAGGVGTATSAAKGFSLGDFLALGAASAGTPAFDVIANWILDQVSEAMQAVIPDWAYTALSNIGAGLALGAAAGSVIPGVGTIAGAIIGGIIGNLASFDYSKVWEAIQNGWDKLKGKTLEIIATVKNDAKNWWKNVETWWEKRVGSVKEFTTEVKNNASTWWNNVKTWWKEEIGPATVTEFITNVKNQASIWWNNVKTWWGEKVGSVSEFKTAVKNQASTWWNDTKAYWDEKVGSVASFYTNVKDQASTWWKNVKTWWDKKVGSVTGFTTNVKDQASTWWDNVKTWWNNFTRGKYLSITAKVHSTSNGDVAGGKTGSFADGGFYKNGRWSPITAYAGGGLPDMGEVFIARESGPELVGRMGGGTAIMNNNQIVASVSAGVYQAVAAAMSQASNGQVMEVHVHLEGDAAGVFQIVKQENDRRVLATGQPALLV